MICQTRLWYYFLKLVQIFYTTRGTQLYQLPLIRSLLFSMLHKRSSRLSYGVFTTFKHSSKHLEYCKEWGGGLCGENIPID